MHPHTDLLIKLVQASGKNVAASLRLGTDFCVKTVTNVYLKLQKII